MDSGFLTTTPTCGLPSRDAHFLRDDAASTDRPLGTQFVSSPQKARTPGKFGVNKGMGEGLGVGAGVGVWRDTSS